MDLKKCGLVKFVGDLLKTNFTNQKLLEQLSLIEMPPLYFTKEKPKKLSRKNLILKNKIDKMDVWTIKTPDYGLLEGRTRNFIDKDDLFNLVF